MAESTRKKTTADVVAGEAKEPTGVEERTFVAEVGGVEREFIDVLPADLTVDTMPAVFNMMGNAASANKYFPIAIETILGEDQAMGLVMEGVSQADMNGLVQAWIKNRGFAGK